MEDLIKVMSKANELLNASGDDLTTYADDSSADHGDGQHIGRQEAYGQIIKFCAEEIIKKF